MRQTTPTLVVDTTKINEEEMMYELNITPRASLDSQYTTSTSMGDLKKSTPPSTFPPQQIPQGPSLQPSLRLLFSLISRRHFFFLLLPAILSSIIAGGIAPFMTFVVGQAFNAFAQYPLTPNPPQEAKDTLLRGVGLAALELVGLAIGSLALGSITSSLWIWVGEINALAVRERVYDAVTNKEMVWFDTQIGMGGSADSVDEDSQPVGAGGLMAKFSRETDDVRTASSLASGMVLQYLTTTIACLILAFVRSWALTLVILSAVPLLTFIQGLSQGLAGPLLNHEREETGVAATMVDRAVSGIATVKAFNAAPFELARTALSFTRLQVAAKSLNKVWGVTSGLAQFVMMAMFVQGFWFGSKLVREGRVNAGDVMAVFWACLIATSNLQMCIPMMITLTKGKMAMVALMELVGSDSPAPISNSEVPSSPVMPTHSRGSKSRTLRKIVPTRCHGELALHSVTFSYPSRPTLPVLSSVSLFLPANEITFIVGASGSGKSTIAGLLLRMYQPRDDSGMVLLDEQDVRFLDEKWMRRHLVGVGQQGAAGVVILEGQSIWDNILVGLPEDDPYSITFSPNNKFTLETSPASLRLRVETACRAALLHEFIRDMPNGYETILGGGAGLGLSGGQKQRLAIARAVLRDPTVLILDEPTSALDPTTRLLVFSALKQQRKNKTTIVITHDLSQIEKNDFVYVMKDGRVVEGGYRCDLEEVFESDNMDGRGEFKKMMESQMKTGGFLPAVEDGSTPTPIYDEEEEESNEDEERDVGLASIRPLTWGNWMFEVVADLTQTANATSTGSPSELEKGQQQNASNIPAYKKKRPSSIAIPQTPIVEEDEILSPESKRYSLPFTPNSVATSFTAVDRSYYGYGAGSGKHLPSSLSKGHISEESPEYEEEEKEFDSQKNAIKKSGDAVSASRKMTRNRANAIQMTEIKVVSNATPVEQQQEHEEDFSQPPFWKLMRAIFPTIPNKPLLFAGIAISLLSGAMTPLFSFLLSRLLFEVSIGATNTKVINFFGGLVLGTAAFDGLLLGTKYFIMETVGMSWVTRIRNISFSRVLAQDKTWFDMPKHAPARLAQIIVRDADDARDLVSVVWAQFCVVIAMLSVGLIWALVQGWQLTLVGFAIAPVFAGVMAVQTMLVARCEVRNKRAREEVARGYYEAIVHVRGIRAMSCEKVFEGQFKAAAENALKTGVRGAFVEGCTYGVASGLIYLAEALLFYVGAVLISKGLYTYLQMVQVLNLVVFTVTIGSQLMAFTQRIAKCVQATSDFNKLMTLSTDNTSESSGSIKTDLSGPISLSNVSFTYPSRPSQPVLRNVNLTVKQGERVALVGSSGSGKSTIAALLQRLYEPTGGKITVGDVNLDQMDVKHLRKQVSVVSQQPNLFDASVAENVRYGGVATFTGNDDDLVISDIGIRAAAKKALVHDFVMGLPQGYDTPVGENASLISGGQAQRLQIARALARPSRVLILDECTSALDPENQTAVLDTIMGLRDDDERRTTIMVTHKLQVMQTCDRIVVVHEGVIAEEGTYQQLMERKGVFATLATAGEWNGE